MNFSDSVIKHFDFLVSQFGYSRKITSETDVQYQLKQQSVIFAYDSQRSYEIVISLGDETDSRNAIPFHILGLMYGETTLAKQLSYFASQQMPAIDDYLKKVSIFMQEKMYDILMGNQDELKNAKAILMEESRVYTQAQKERTYRENAGNAWSKKDYVLFLKIMHQADFAVTELDKRKIEFAKKYAKEETV